MSFISNQFFKIDRYFSYTVPYKYLNYSSSPIFRLCNSEKYFLQAAAENSIKRMREKSLSRSGLRMTDELPHHLGHKVLEDRDTSGARNTQILWLCKQSPQPVCIIFNILWLPLSTQHSPERTGPFGVPQPPQQSTATRRLKHELAALQLWRMQVWTALKSRIPPGGSRGRICLLSFPAPRGRQGSSGRAPAPIFTPAAPAGVFLTLHHSDQLLYLPLPLLRTLMVILGHPESLGWSPLHRVLHLIPPKCPLPRTVDSKH